MNEEVRNEQTVEETTNVENNETTVNEVEVVEENQEKTSLFSKILYWIRKVASIVGSAILAIMLIVVGWIAIDKFVVGNPVPSFMGYSVLNIATGSMSGTIEEGDVIIIKKTDDYKIGDIVTYLPETYDRKTISTTHRIIRINDDGTIVCKGDANNSEDAEIKREQIVGEVKIDENGQPLSVIRNVGIFVDWVKEGGGLIYIISFIGIIGAGVYLLTKKED